MIFQNVMTHAAKNMRKHLKLNILESMLKCFSMFIIKHYYEDNEKMKGFGIKNMNCNKMVGCKIINKISENSSLYLSRLLSFRTFISLDLYNPRDNSS